MVDGRETGSGSSESGKLAKLTFIWKVRLRGLSLYGDGVAGELTLVCEG